MITHQSLEEIYRLLGHDGLEQKDGYTRRFIEEEIIYLLMRKKIKCYLYHRASYVMKGEGILEYPFPFFDQLLKEEGFKILFNRFHAWVEYFGKVYDPAKEDIKDVDEKIYKNVEAMIIIRERI